MPSLNDVAAMVGTAGGTVVATVTVMKFLDARREKRRRIKVTVSHSWPVYGRNLGPRIVLVEASNPGSQSVVLESWGFLLPNGGTLVSFAPVDGTVRLPHKLPPGENCKMWMESLPLKQQLLESGFQNRVELVGFYSDALGVKHKSKVFGFDLPHST